MTSKQIKQRLEYLRGEIKAERISYGGIVELQSLAKYIPLGDTLLQEWAGVPEQTNKKYRVAVSYQDTIVASSPVEAKELFLEHLDTLGDWIYDNVEVR